MKSFREKNGCFIMRILKESLSMLRRYEFFANIPPIKKKKMLLSFSLHITSLSALKLS